MTITISEKINQLSISDLYALRQITEDRKLLLGNQSNQMAKAYSRIIARIDIVISHKYTEIFTING